MWGNLWSVAPRESKKSRALGACLRLALLSEVLAVFSRPFGTYPFAIGTQHSVLG
jgi:hypothetical protein